jgi:hypothetical protein
MNGLNITEVITLATEAMGRTTEDISNFVFRFEHFKNDTYEFTPDEMFKFAQLVAAAEREACAKVSEEYYEYYGHERIAHEIRARGQG